MRTSEAFLVRGLVGLCGFIASSGGVAAQAQPPLFEQTSYAVPGIGFLIDVDVADVDGDGLTDIGVLGSNGGYRLLLGRGDGLFFPPIASPVGAAPWSVTLADVTGDGRADRLLVDLVTVRVQASLGTGQFHLIGAYSLSGCFGFEVHVADLNGDSLPDFAASWGDSITCLTGITTYLGDGRGQFHDDFTLLLPTVQTDMQSLAPADLDGDGDLDLAGNSTGGTFGRFLGAGDGTFAQVLPFATEARSADVADIDADGWPDVLGILDGDLQVYRGSGGGAFAPVLASPGAPDSFQAWEFAHLALGDLNGDGHVDAAGSKDGQLLISLGTGSGGFEPAAELIPVAGADQVRSADVNGDASLDLVVGTSGQIVVLVNDHPAWPWSTVAPGLPADSLDAPKLSAAGTLEVGDPVSLTLGGGASGAPAVLIVGAMPINAPFKGGVLVPQPLLLLPVTLDPSGGFALAGTLPVALPSGAKLYLQTWIVDAAGPAGFTSSNAVVGTAP